MEQTSYTKGEDKMIFEIAVEEDVVPTDTYVNVATAYATSSSVTNTTSSYYPYTDVYRFDYPNNYTYVWPTVSTVYKYQLICPRCSTSNWGAIDETVTCKGLVRAPKARKSTDCGALLKAVNKKVDYEVPVG